MSRNNYKQRSFNPKCYEIVLNAYPYLLVQSAHLIRSSMDFYSFQNALKGYSSLRSIKIC